jgi:hypothetical protein
MRREKGVRIPVKLLHLIDGVGDADLMATSPCLFFSIRPLAQSEKSYELDPRKGYVRFFRTFSCPSLRPFSLGPFACD